MNILLINCNQFLQKELEEFMGRECSNIFSTASALKAINILDHNSIDMVLLRMNTISDVALLNYINNNYKKIKVLLSAERNLKDVISSIKDGNYTILHDQDNLAEINKYFQSIG